MFLIFLILIVCIESFLPIGWHTFIWYKNPPKCCSILVWIAEWWSSSLSSRNPKENWCPSRTFGARFGEKDSGLSTCKLWSEQAGELEAFLHDAAQNLEVVSNIQHWYEKIKTFSGWCPFKGLSNGTTLMQIQSGRTVPLKVHKREKFFGSDFEFFTIL